MSPPKAAPPEAPTNFVYVGLLSLISLLVAVVGWFSIGTVNRVEATLNKVVVTATETAGEVAKLRTTIDLWSKEEFVPRAMFEMRKAENERRMATMEQAIKELKDIKGGR